MNDNAPSRELERVAAYLRAMGRADLAAAVLRGEHWKWNPQATEGTTRFSRSRKGRSH